MLGRIAWFGTGSNIVSRWERWWWGSAHLVIDFILGLHGEGLMLANPGLLILVEAGDVHNILSSFIRFEWGWSLSHLTYWIHLCRNRSLLAASSLRYGPGQQERCSAVHDAGMDVTGLATKSHWHVDSSTGCLTLTIPKAAMVDLLNFLFILGSCSDPARIGRAL